MRVWYKSLSYSTYGQGLHLHYSNWLIAIRNSHICRRSDLNLCHFQSSSVCKHRLPSFLINQLWKCRIGLSIIGTTRRRNANRRWRANERGRRESYIPVTIRSCIIITSVHLQRVSVIERKQLTAETIKGRIFREPSFAASKERR